MGWQFGRGLVAASIASLGLSSVSFAESPREIEFNRDLRPILSGNCFQGHGPDAKARQAELRLDREEEAFAARKDGPAIVRHKPAESELVRRITHADPAERMPPAEIGSAPRPERRGFCCAKRRPGHRPPQAGGKRAGAADHACRSSRADAAC